MTSVPPPYSTREHAQVQPGSSVSTGSTTQSHEFQETTSVCLEWKLTGLKTMYESTRGEQKSKCIKSAVFGDADSLWEVLWYPNAGTSTQTAGDHVSLYLSCVPTAQERDSSIQNKWVRKGLWWFKFEIRPIPFDARSTTNNRHDILASKDASDHTFAVKTANWGWQAFAKRDSLFQHPQVLSTDSFMIVCTIQAQPQPPAGLWLGVGLQPSQQGLINPNGGNVGSGGGLSAWASSDGSAGGVAGGTAAAGGVKRVVPKDLISSVGSMLDDPLYSDVEFVIPARRGSGSAPRRIYANKKLLNRCDYFEAMFNGGFKEVEGVYEEDESDDDLEILSDSDMDDESSVSQASFDDQEHERGNGRLSPDLHLTTTTSRNSSPRRQSTSADRPLLAEPREDVSTTTSSENGTSTSETKDEQSGEVGDITVESMKEVLSKKGTKNPANANETKSNTSTRGAKLTSSGAGTARSIGPKKTRVVIRDAAWSTWWAVLYWIYTDIIYFAPLTSSFEHQLPRRPSNIPSNATNSTTNVAESTEPKTRKEWIHRWMIEHEIDSRSSFSGHHTERRNGDDDDDDDDEGDLVIGPRPVSAKAIYRLADKLDLPSLKLRAFQHICAGLTAGNVPAEVFSRFSSTYEDVRKVQVAFFLKHWSEIKKSETMTQIWQQIRNGKHVGFEEVWPLIVGQLDFRPS
ncbi:uncharacterized protein IL334_001952 [Kwoniella shivajii]|uniref:MATH domain-containing protein n=1 Tax=Kwoniella shivajii TaxID=564305 RepID=A0ABZ1CTL6_9TREE|nr:hypothetical protein IL334_001952 [Kwoniella shivajii]